MFMNGFTEICDSGKYKIYWKDLGNGKFQSVHYDARCFRDNREIKVWKTEIDIHDICMDHGLKEKVDAWLYEWFDPADFTAEEKILRTAYAVDDILSDDMQQNPEIVFHTKESAVTEMENLITERKDVAFLDNDHERRKFIEHEQEILEYACKMYETVCKYLSDMENPYLENLIKGIDVPDEVMDALYR